MNMESERNKRIKDFVKYKKLYDVKKKITNRIAHCNACKKEIDKKDERAIINDGVVTQRFMLCLDCLELYFSERKRYVNTPMVYSEQEYSFMMSKYEHLLRDEFTAKELYVDGFSNQVFVKYGNVGLTIYEDTTTEDTPMGHDLEAVLLAVLNLQPKSECIIYSNNKPMVDMLNQSYKKKVRKNEELIAFVKAVFNKKELDIVFQYFPS